MTRPTTKQRLDYKQMILDCQIRRFTDRETLEYFHINGINDISLPTLKRYKTQIRHGAQRWIASLARSRRAEYIAEYRERIDEILKCQKELWNIYNDKNTKPPVKVMALSKIMDSTMKLLGCIGWTMKDFGWTMKDFDWTVADAREVEARMTLNLPWLEPNDYKPSHKVLLPDEFKDILSHLISMNIVQEKMLFTTYGTPPGGLIKYEQYLAFANEDMTHEILANSEMLEQALKIFIHRLNSELDKKERKEHFHLLISVFIIIICLTTYLGSRLLDSIGVDQEIQKKVITFTKRNQERMTEETGIQSSLTDEDVKEYLEQGIREVKKDRRAES